MKVVLYAEDDADDVFFMERAFHQAGIGARLVTVPHGGEVIAYLARKGRFSVPAASPAPDLVILDLNLPQVSGFDVLRWIQAEPACRGLTTVIFTSSGNDRDRQQASRLGARDYMVKPGDPSALGQILRRFLEPAENATDSRPVI